MKNKILLITSIGILLVLIASIVGFFIYGDGNTKIEMCDRREFKKYLKKLCKEKGCNKDLPETNFTIKHLKAGYDEVCMVTIYDKNGEEVENKMFKHIIFDKTSTFEQID